MRVHSSCRWNCRSTLDSVRSRSATNRIHGVKLRYTVRIRRADNASELVILIAFT